MIQPDNLSDLVHFCDCMPRTHRILNTVKRPVVVLHFVLEDNKTTCDPDKTDP